MNGEAWPGRAPRQPFATWMEQRLDELSERTPRAIDAAAVPSTFRRAAVLLPLWRDGDRVETVLTLRTRHLSSHRGQISLPGGAIDPTDASNEAAALRETWEELDIAPEHIDVRMRLDDVWSVQQYHVTPFVGQLAGRPDMTPSEHEIERIIVADLERLMDPSIHRVQSVRRGDDSFGIHYFDYDGDIIWGLTGAILHGFFELLRGRDVPAGELGADTLRRFLALQETA